MTNNKLIYQPVAGKRTLHIQTPHVGTINVKAREEENNPLSPPLRSLQRRPKALHTKSKLLAATRTAAFVFSLVFSGMMDSSLRAATFVAWDPAPVTSSGTADGVTVTIEYSPAQTSVNLTSIDMSGTNFDPPGSSVQTTVNVAPDIGMTWNFDQPVEDLLLYIEWRGTGNLGPSDGLYTFDQTPTIQSGLTGGSISGNSLVVTNASNFFSGILSFPGELTSLTLEAPDALGFGKNPYTMSLSAVPEPSSAGLVVAAGCLATILRRRRLSPSAIGL